MSEEEREFWNRVSDYRRDYTDDDYRGRAVAAALELRRQADDMLADFAAYCADTDDAEDYVRWLQRAGEDVSSRISLALGVARSDEDAELHLSFAYAILREVAADALSRRD